MTKQWFITLASRFRILGTKWLTNMVENHIALVAWCNSAPSFLSQSQAPITIRWWRTGSFTLVWSTTWTSSKTQIEYAQRASLLYNSLKTSWCQRLSSKDSSPANLVPNKACSAIYKLISSGWWHHLRASTTWPTIRYGCRTLIQLYGNLRASNWQILRSP